MTDPDPGAHSRPEPVMDAASRAGNITAAVAGLATALVSYAAITQQAWAVAAAAFLSAVSAGLTKALPTVTAQGARAQVTPLSSPRGFDGAPLAPAAPHEAP